MKPTQPELPRKHGSDPSAGPGAAVPGAEPTSTAPPSAHLLRITGSLAEIEPASAAFLYELVRVGDRGLLGEVVRIEGERATAQIYEDTTGLRLDEPAELTGESLVAELGPGLLGAVLDGVGRPLPRVAEVSGDLLQPGVHLPTLDPTRAWAFEARRQPGDEVVGGDVLGVVAETPGIVSDRRKPSLSVSIVAA